MVKKNLNWFLPVLAIALMSMGQLFAQDTELTSIKVADDKAADKDACDKGCTFDWGEDTWLTVGAGLRVSYRASRDSNGLGVGEPGAYDNNFNIDNARVYLNGRGHDCLGFEFNLDTNNAQGYFDHKQGAHYTGDDSSDMRILDAIVKFEFNDLVNIWMGRMLPPSDRANLSGPFYQNAGWDFPFSQFGYQDIFQGRDDGAAVWGQLAGGAVKYQVGVFEGVNAGFTETESNGAMAGGDDVLLAGRFTVNLLDPEPGYYNASTYHGEKDILAIGYAFHRQNDSIGINQYRQYSFDVLFETTLGNGGVVTAAGAYYDTTGSFVATNNGRSYMIEASYLTAREFALGCCVSGRIAPFWRHQEYTRDIAGVDRVNDWGFHYVMYGHNARVTYVYSDADLDGDEADTHLIGVQLQY
jgi:hypothetical protein